MRDDAVVRRQVSLVERPSRFMEAFMMSLGSLYPDDIVASQHVFILRLGVPKALYSNENFFWTWNLIG